MSVPASDAQNDAGAAQSFVRWASRGLLGLNVATLLFWAASVMITRPRFEAAFANLGVPLPGLTAAFLAVPAAVLAVGALLVAALLIIKEFVLRRRGMALAINLASFALAAILVAVYIVAMYLPLITAPYTITP